MEPLMRLVGWLACVFVTAVAWRFWQVVVVVLVVPVQAQRVAAVAAGVAADSGAGPRAGG